MRARNFTARVFEMAKKIPRGRVSTYKAMAKRLDCRAYRAVGNALNKNKSKDIPCHRIINSNGSIGGFNQGSQEKIKLLRKEGIEIRNKKADLAKYLFDV